jgi:glycine/D-amino acid oxidase-like deaminating enzyme
MGAAVTLFERGELGQEQSSRALGYVRCQGRHRAEIALAVAANKMWPGLSGELQADLEYVREGNLVVAETEADEARLLRSAEAARAHGLSTRAVDRVEIARISPRLAGPWRSGIFTAEDGHTAPAKATDAFGQAARRNGTEIKTGVGVRAIILRDGRASGVATDAGVHEADAVLSVAGVSTNFLLQPLGWNLPIQTVRSSNAETVPQAPFTRTGVWTPYVSMRPRLDGSFAFGTGYRGTRLDHDVGAGTLAHLRRFLPLYVRNPRRPRMRFNRDFADSVRRRLSVRAATTPMPEPVVNEGLARERLVWAERFFPHLKPLALARAWSGRIDVTPDMIPVIGALGRPAGVYVAAGFCAHGLAISPVVGKSLAEMIVTGRSAADLRPFRPERFREGDFADDPTAL